jgi:tRNA pseudouridine55 synthase
MIDGLVVVDKPAGWTSHDVVAKLRGVFGQRRIGHAGTLDPDATGVLLVGLGRATRLMRYLQETTKEYDAVVAFGVATDTLDASGAVLDRAAMSITRAELEGAAERFTGDIMQVPPMVSALKVGGRRLHEMARAGEEIERDARPVRIDRLVVRDFEPGPFPRASISVQCSSGTYVRSLAADLGAALGGTAHLAELRRTRVGTFSLDDAHPLMELVDAATHEGAVLSPAEAMRALPRIQVDDECRAAVCHGSVFPAGVLGAEGPGPFALVDGQETLLAVYERRGSAIKPSVVLGSSRGNTA